jgi:hypothetical protein
LTYVQVAAKYYRADLCRLLTQHGLRPDLDIFLTSPFATCLTSRYNTSSRADEVETVRLLLQSCDQVDQFDEDSFWWIEITLETIEWIWFNAALYIDDDELANIRVSLLSGIFQQCVTASFYGFEIDHYTETIVRLIGDAHMSEYYLGGNFGFLNTLFAQVSSSFDSQVHGTFYLDLLERLNMNVEACMARQFDFLPDGVLGFFSRAIERKVVFEPLDHGGWLLGWIWVFDDSAPGYLLVSEHIGLGPDNYTAYGWPFFQHPLYFWSQEGRDRWAKVEARSTRRLANKARKERARTGQKQPRSRMPGAWNW